jgi:hypothetical protein
VRLEGLAHLDIFVSIARKNARHQLKAVIKAD